MSEGEALCRAAPSVNFDTRLMSVRPSKNVLNCALRSAAPSPRLFRIWSPLSMFTDTKLSAGDAAMAGPAMAGERRRTPRAARRSQTNMDENLDIARNPVPARESPKPSGSFRRLVASSWQRIRDRANFPCHAAVADLVLAVLAIEAARRGVEIDRAALDPLDRIEVARAQVEDLEIFAPRLPPDVLLEA